MMLLGKKGMNAQSPIFVRIFKEESELEVWKLRDDGRYYHFKTYPICTLVGRARAQAASQGDRQAPEGFYTVTREQMNPDSRYHLAFNLGYPNAYDKSHRRTGDALMVHGKCTSAGCYAMTDALMEEIYALAREAFIGGQDSYPRPRLPVPHDGSQPGAARQEPVACRFWQTLKEGYDYFELTRQVPTVAVCNRRYVVNVSHAGDDAVRLDPEGACPVFQRPTPSPFTPRPGEQMAEPQVVVPGPKMRTVETFAPDTPRSGLTKAPEAGNSWWRRYMPRFLTTPGQ